MMGAFIKAELLKNNCSRHMESVKLYYNQVGITFKKTKNIGPESFIGKRK